MGSFIIKSGPSDPVLQAAGSNGVPYWITSTTPNACAGPASSGTARLLPARFTNPPDCDIGFICNAGGETASIDRTFGQLGIYLDGSLTPKSINQLPSGFLITGTQFTSGSIAFIPGIVLDGMSIPERDYWQLEIECLPLVSSYTMLGGDSSFYERYVPGGAVHEDVPPTLISLIGLNTLNIEFSILSPTGNGQIVYGYDEGGSGVLSRFEGAYVLWSTEFDIVVNENNQIVVTVTNPVDEVGLIGIEIVEVVNPDDPTEVISSDVPASPGNPSIRIVSRTVSGTEPLIVSTLTFEIIDENDLVINPIYYLFWFIFFTFYANIIPTPPLPIPPPIYPALLYPRFQFYVGLIPPGIDPPPPTDDIIITGSGGGEGNGSATSVRNVDTSGLYFLNPDKTNDTLYLRETVTSDPIDTEVVKIPNPKIKLGYLGG